MVLQFYKYQGTGNDFIMVDNRNRVIDRNNLDLVRSLCDRKFGIGGDGLILIEGKEGYDFDCIYFNSDGSQSFCGNGARCVVAFANFLGIIKDKAHFYAIDGDHDAVIEGDLISVKMIDVDGIEIGDNYSYLYTGSPHYIKFVDHLSNVDVVDEGKSIRYNDRFKKEGTNVNFVEIEGDRLAVRTYERGVEDETLACGTGVTAVALAVHKTKGDRFDFDHIKVEGGELGVKFEVTDKGYQNVWLCGPAKQVYSGKIEI